MMPISGHRSHDSGGCGVWSLIFTVFAIVQKNKKVIIRQSVYKSQSALYLYEVLSSYRYISGFYPNILGKTRANG
jgi:hypothetical protein